MAAGHKDYSGTPLAKKLGIKDGARVALVGAPEGFRTLIEPLPQDVRIATRATGSKDVIVVFTRKEAELRTRFATLAKALDDAGGLWVAYPKKSSKLQTDLTFTSVQEIGLAAGLVDNKSVAVDEDWSGVRFVYRLADRKRC